MQKGGRSGCKVGHDDPEITHSCGEYINATRFFFKPKGIQ